MIIEQEPRIISFGFLYASSTIGMRDCLIILHVLNLFGLMFTFLVPETKGKSLEEISGEGGRDQGHRYL